MRTMIRIWVVVILAASMLTGCVVAAGPPYDYDNYGYYGYGNGHGHGHEHEEDDD